MSVHGVALEDGDGAGFLAENHGIKCHQSVEVRQAVEQGETDGAAVDATDVGFRVCGNQRKRVDARAVIA
ncbi:MAG: hypothetical protein P8X94_12125 [Woeseiaceae bacterium]